MYEWYPYVTYLGSILSNRFATYSLSDILRRILHTDCLSSSHSSPTQSTSFLQLAMLQVNYTSLLKGGLHSCQVQDGKNITIQVYLTKSGQSDGWATGIKQKVIQMSCIFSLWSEWILKWFLNHKLLVPIILKTERFSLRATAMEFRLY